MKAAPIPFEHLGDWYRIHVGGLVERRDALLPYYTAIDVDSVGGLRERIEKLTRCAHAPAPKAKVTWTRFAKDFRGYGRNLRARMSFCSDMNEHVISSATKFEVGAEVEPQIYRRIDPRTLKPTERKKLSAVLNGFNRDESDHTDRVSDLTFEAQPAAPDPEHPVRHDRQGRLREERAALAARVPPLSPRRGR